MALLLTLEKYRGVVFLCLIFAWFGPSNGAVYKVGDAAGWTIIGNVNYTDWAFNKTFRVGDLIVFEYNPQLHNVMQVKHAEYRACNVSFPISTYNTGNDSITIQTHRHHFFLCGVPGHCQSGQKVDINVLAATPPNPPVATSPSGLIPSPVPPSTVPAPSRGDAATACARLNMPLGWVVFAAAAVVLFRW